LALADRVLRLEGGVLVDNVNAVTST